MTINAKDIESLVDNGIHYQSENQFSDHDDYKKFLENESFFQDINERKTFAYRAYKITKAWIIFLIILTSAQFVYHGLSVTEFNIVFSTTTGSVLAFWYLVGKYLFNSKK